MRALMLLMLGLSVVGCNSTPSTPETSKTDQPAVADPSGMQGAPGTTSTSTAPATGQAGGIAPVTTAPIPNAPVTGTESLQGGGSAVGTVAKDRAKQAASQAGGSSAGQMGDGE